MFDAIVFADADPEPAARTLSTLVEGAVEGLLNRMLVLSGAASDGLAALADAAGCRLEQGVAERDRAAVLRRHLETAHALAFEAGALLPPGWPAQLRQEFRRRGEPDSTMSLVFRPARRLDHLKLLAHVSLRGRMPIRHGLLAPRSRLIEGLRAGSVHSHGPIHMTELTVART